MNKDEIRQKAHVWYMNIPFDKSVAMCAKYYPKTDFDEITWDQLIEMYLKEHPTEAEVSKEVNYREVAEKLFKKTLHENLSPYDAILKGMKWQKEQGRVLIEDLLEIVNVLSATINPDDYTREFKSKVRNSITKAEQHIKKNNHDTE